MPTIKLPAASKTMKSGTVRHWLKKPGDVVVKGDLLVELDTESGVIQIEAPVGGHLSRVLAEKGKTVQIHGELGVIDGEGSNTAPSVSMPPEAAAKAKAAGGKVVPVLMPKAGQSMEEGTINKWHVQVGAQIKKGQVIFEVETDKANMDVEATDSGRLARIMIGDGGTIAVLQPVAYLADNDADVDAMLGSTGGTGSARGTGSTGGLGLTPDAAAAAMPEGTAAVGGHAAGENAGANQPHDGNGSKSSHASPAVSNGGRVMASPAARKIADERGVDISSLPAGSGPRGRILSTDVPTRVAPPASKPTGAGTRKRMSGMRKAIAKNLLQSKQTIPHFYVRLTVDAAPSLAFYRAQKEKYPCSINDVITLVVSRLVKEFPAFRSRIEGDEMVESPGANIGIAVGMDDGLVVPVLQNADGLSLQQIAAETKRIAASSRAGKIEGMGTGSFTITNLGMFGTEEFAAIINPPEAAILAVGAAREAVVVKDGAMKAGKVMTLTLSADHRIIDGMLAAKFLSRMKDLLEKPDSIK